MRRAIDRGAAGIAVSVIDRRALNKPTAEALSRGIPVVSYNADGGIGNKRLAYIGQDCTSPASSSAPASPSSSGAARSSSSSPLPGS